MAVCAWSLAGGSLFVAPAGALAATAKINISAGPLDRSLRRLSDDTGVSIGSAGRLPTVQTRQVRGAASPAEALRQMLDGTGYRAVATGPASFRIERAPVSVAPSPTPPPPPSEPVEEAPREIVVTALKRPTRLSSLPATAHVLRASDLRAPIGLAGTDRVSQEVPSLISSSLGPGRNRLFLRGIGDGPLNGFNQGSVAILLNEARLNYDAPDPDWALIDIDQVEILEGPQGPLYGTGALGGIVKVSTNRPDLARASAQLAVGLASTREGDLSNRQSAIVNLPLVTGALGVRVVAYRQDQAGWIDDVGGARNSNRERLTGGRVSLRWHPFAPWTVDLTLAGQERSAADSQYVDGGLGPVQRPHRGREPRDLDNRLAMMTIAGQLGGLELTSITSATRQEAGALYDATPLAPLLGTSGMTMVNDDRRYRLFDQELRLSNRNQAGFEWLTGISYIKASTNADIQARDATSIIPLLTFRRSVTEAALFGEASMTIAPHLTVGGGARVFSSHLDDEGQEGASGSLRSKRNIRGAGSASVSWTPSATVTVFLHAASAYRPGGINVERDATQAVHDADELASLELGSHVRLGGAFSLDGTMFAARWQHVQTDELLANGLVATRNAGNARNLGVEADLRWSVMPASEIGGGIILQRARLETADQVQAIDDPRLPAVPQFAARLKYSQGFHLGAWDGKANVGIRYSGATHLSFDPILDRRTGGHATIDASIAVARDGWTAALIGDNLTNSSEDTFAFGNPYRVRAVPQHTPTKPVTIGITLGRRF